MRCGLLRFLLYYNMRQERECEDGGARDTPGLRELVGI